MLLSVQNGRHGTHELKPRESRVARNVAGRAKRIVIDGENPADFEKLHKAVVRETRPRPGAEQELLFLKATLLWRLRRIPEFEADFLAQQTDGVYRDPRVDSLIEDRVLLERWRHEIRDRYAPRKSQRERATEFGDAGSDLKNEQVEGESAKDSGDRDQRVRNRYNQLLQPQRNQPPLSPAENQEALLKIARYESSLMKSLRATSKLLSLLVNRRKKDRAP